MNDLYSIHSDGHVSPRRPTRKVAHYVDDPLAGIGTVGRIEEPPHTSEPPPSDRQMVYIRDLCAERGLEVPQPRTRSEASDHISRLKSMPRFPQGVSIERIVLDDCDGKGGRDGYYALKVDGKRIPVGKYALENAPTNTENDISFWSVWVNDSGTIWRLKQVVGPDYQNVQHGSILPVLRA